MYCIDIWSRCLAVEWMLMYDWCQSAAICELLAMPIKVVPVRSVASEAEAEHANNDGYRHRCPSTTESYKIIQSLMFSFTLMWFIGWRDFSKAGFWVHVTKSTVYGFVVLLFLSSDVIRWCLIVHAEDQFNIQLIYKLIAVTGSLETLSHAIGFFIASLSYERLPEFLFEWDNLQNTASLKKETNICTGVMWLLACLNAAFCGYLIFNFHLSGDILFPIMPDDEPSKVLVVKIINLVAQIYLLLAWIAPSALLFTITNSLAWEFNHNTGKFRELRNNFISITENLDSIMKHHERLCNLVNHADDIFSMQIAATFLGSLMLICLILYIIIRGEDVSTFVRCIHIYWLTTAVSKILIDCISGARLNQAVSMEHKHMYKTIFTKILYYNNRYQI